ncbi:hypothetical protein EHF_0525 [Ehrlichia japonica]|uniref:Uncharacterized protein n=1 Tax=Ehrlichia japonica TaxID=391036 RepID=X5GKC8_9RICK|nr:hypothetical protein EHF_0525 [Ehrlichia japonica]
MIKKNSVFNGKYENILSTSINNIEDITSDITINQALSVTHNK